MRRRFLVAYDIADDRRRNRVFRTLYGYGDHAQFSVFFCELNARELVELRAKLKEAIHDTEDQVMILDLGSAANPLEAGLDCIGKPYRPTTSVVVV